MLWKSFGPLWCRGYFKKYTDDKDELDRKYGERPSVNQIDGILKRQGAKSIVIGHSKVKDFTSLFGGRRVLAIDIPWTDSENVRGLWIEKDKFGQADANGI